MCDTIDTTDTFDTTATSTQKDMHLKKMIESIL